MPKRINERYNHSVMDPALTQLPPKAKDLLHQLETYCGLEFQVIYNPDLHGREPEILASSDGSALRIGKDGLAHNITHFEGDRLVNIGIEHCMDPLTVEVVAHELLHMKHILLDQTITKMEYSPRVGLDSANSGLYNVLDYIEHIFVYRGMTALGLTNPEGAAGIRLLLTTLWHQPAALQKRIIGFMSWLEVCFCFPEIKEYAAARLLEANLFDDASKLEARVRPELRTNRLAIISYCLQAIGLQPQDVTIGMYQRHEGKWRLRWLGSRP